VQQPHRETGQEIVDGEGARGRDGAAGADQGMPTEVLTHEHARAYSSCERDSATRALAAGDSQQRRAEISRRGGQGNLQRRRRES